MGQKNSFKYAVIGSGAGGAPAALKLAESLGDQVVLIEQGQTISPAEINQLEKDMLPRLYAQGGTQGTADGSISVLQGVNLGGSTFVNDALCFKPPEEIVTRFGAYGASIDYEKLLVAADAVEKRMGVTEIPKTMINRANYLLGLGASRRGLDGERLRHNSPGCVECGFRALGCAYGAKMSTDLSFVPAFTAAGGVLHTGVTVSHLSRAGSQWRIACSDREYLVDRVIVAAGVIQTPTILLRSGFSDIGAGTGLQFHLQTIAWGDFKDPVDGHNGIPMSYGVMSFSDVYGYSGPGYLIEGVGYQPMAINSLSPYPPAEKEAFLRRYRHLAGGVMLLRSSSRGTVTLVNGKPQIDYPVNADDYKRMGHFYKSAADLYFAAGADRVWLSHRQVPWVDKPTTVPASLAAQSLYTAHPFGGACLGTTLDADHSVRGTKDLWVLDASAFPEALGVNPQITIAGLSSMMAEQILDS